MKKLLIIIIVAMACLPADVVNAQEDEISKEVRVVKDYQPIIYDADKVIRDPEIEDTTQIRPSVNYNISPVKHSTSFDMRPIQPARLVGVPLDELYNYFLKVGLGNYWTPMAEFSYNSLRSRDFAFGADAYHKSSLGKLKLANDHKVYAGYSDNRVGFRGKYMADEHVFSGKLGFSSNTLHYYGYNTDLFTDSLPDFDNKDIRQRHNYVSGDFSARSNYTDTLRLKYELSLHLGQFSDFYDEQQSNVVFTAGVSKQLDAFHMGGDIKWEQYQSTTAPDSIMGGIIHVSPWLRMQGDDWLMKLGLTGVSDAVYNDFYVYPNALFEFSLVEKVLLPYLGATGGLEPNHYYQLTQQNPYIKNGYHHPYRTHNKITGYTGLKGNLSSRAFYNLGVSLALYDNHVFFINDTTTALQNQFVADESINDLTKITYTGELHVDITDDLSLQGMINMYKYTMGDEDMEPWHLPTHDFRIAGQYNLRDKIKAEVQIMGLGTRKALDFLNEEAIALDPITDVSIAVEYKYTKLMSFYLDLNNLTASKYYRWHQYPSQRLNILLGASYKF